MGLLYVFPVSTEEEDFVHVSAESITLKTYGLPYIFWIYAFCSISVVALMFFAIKDPILKLAELGDGTDATLGYALLSFIAFLPLAVLAFFFYEKRLIKKAKTLFLEYRIFGIKVFSENFQIKELKVAPLLTSPNMARLKGGEDCAGFQNKGYFVLWLETEDTKKILIDRHSRKTDLEKLKSLLELR